MHPGLVDNPLVKVVPLSQPPDFIKTVPFLIGGPLKVIWQILTLLLTLGYRTKPARWLLVQNPPSIPTLHIAFIISLLRNTQLLVDWHNYGWTILRGTKGPTHPFVELCRQYEAFCAKWFATASLTVSKAMEKQLRRPPFNVRSPIFTLHDRPAAIFQPIESQDARRAFLERLSETKPYADAILTGDMRLLVSSTSWTPDEDFNILLEALTKYSPLAEFDRPPVLAIITGKGPDKQKYLDKIAALQAEPMMLDNVTILTAWLSTEDYATLLACADLGVCLHKSSSGVDLPMKVVDMFGAGLPVVGYNQYKSWDELVKEGVNGWGFATASELTDLLEEVLDPDSGDLARLKKGAVEEGKWRWDQEWDNVAGRLFGFCK